MNTGELTASPVGIAVSSSSESVFPALPPGPIPSSHNPQFQADYFRTLADQSLDVISVLDSTGNILFESASITRWTGWTPEELVGRNAFEFVHPADLPMLMARFTSGLISPGSFQLVQYRFRHKDGSWRSIESWGKNLLSDPAVRGVIVTSRDVTDRRRDDLRRAAINDLVSRLNSLESLPGAASAIATVTDQVFCWDAFGFSIYSAKTQTFERLLNLDVINGRRTEVAVKPGNVNDGSLIASVLHGGPLLFNIGEGDSIPGAVPFGDEGRRSASLMFAPVTGTRGPAAVISVQSYREGAYTAEDLELLKEIAGHCTPVLERIMARMELLENEQRYRTLVERLPVAVLIHQDEQVVYANPTAAQLLGAARPEELVGRAIATIAAPDTLEVVRDRVRRASQGETSPWMEVRVVRSDNTLADVEATSLGIAYNGRTAVQTIFHEITNRKRAEQRQAVQYAATRVLANSNYAEATEKLLNLICDGLGWKTAELWTIDPVSRGLRLTSTVHPDHARYRAFAEAGRRLTFRRGEGLPGRIWAEGQPMWVLDAAKERGCLRRELAAAADFRSAVCCGIDVRGDFSGVLILFADTERQRDDDMLELLKVLGTQLGQFLERKQIQEQLLQAQKMEAVGLLAGGVAHDFNNILTVLTGHAQLALSMPDIPAELQLELEEISTAVTRAANLTRQLLTFSRKQMMQKRCLHLDQVINDLAKMLRRLIGEHVSLSIQHQPNLPQVDGDVGMIEQVLLNLAVNARDAMPDGGDLTIISKTVEVDQGHVRRFAHARPGRHVRVEVRDNGCGMTPDVLSRVFEPFFTTKPVGRGTGLGLATVYGIIKQHGGWVEVDSHVNVGTAFQIYLPISTVTPQAAAPINATSVRGHNETILLVEDEISLRSLAQKLLERAGYRVLSAASGVEALGVWQKHRAEVDLVLTDMVMPGGVSGKQLADQLWAIDPGLQVIFTSGYTNELSDESLAKQKLRFLAKPYTPTDLLGSVADAIANPRKNKS